MRSGVNWMREYLRCRTRPSVEAGWFCRAGHAFEQDWPPARRQMRRHDHLLLADDDLADFVAHLIEVAGGELESGVGPHFLF